MKVRVRVQRHLRMGRPVRAHYRTHFQDAFFVEGEVLEIPGLGKVKRKVPERIIGLDVKNFPKIKKTVRAFERVERAEEKYEQELERQKKLELRLAEELRQARLRRRIRRGSIPEEVRIGISPKLVERLEQERKVAGLFGLKAPVPIIKKVRPLRVGRPLPKEEYLEI